MSVQIHGTRLLRVPFQGQQKNLCVLRSEGSVQLFEAYPLVERFNQDHGTSLRIVSHAVADVALTVGDIWCELPTFAADLLIAYERPNVKLKDEVVFDYYPHEPRVVLPTGRFKGEKNIALVAMGLTSTDFKRDRTSIVLDIPDSRLIVVPDFSHPDENHMPHPETGVPTGPRVSRNDSTRYRYSWNGGSSYVGLLARYTHYFFSGMLRRNSQTVVVSFPPSTKFGVVVEVPDADVSKIETILLPQSEGK